MCPEEKAWLNLLRRHYFHVLLDRHCVMLADSSLFISIVSGHIQLNCIMLIKRGNIKWKA